jgi:hypothetical protein
VSANSIKSGCGPIVMNGNEFGLIPNLSSRNLLSYLNRTFGDTANLDDTVVNIYTWVDQGWLGAYSGGLFFGLILLILILGTFILGIRSYIRNGIIKTNFVFLLTGLFLLGPIMVFTERLWPHYLWTAHIFLLLGTVILVGSTLFSKNVSVVIYILLSTGGFISSIKQGKGIFLLEKNQKELIFNSKKAYEYIRSQTDTVVSIQDLSVFYPFSEMVEINRYHPFSSIKPVKRLKGKHIWNNMIEYAIIENERVDFIVLNNFDFINLNYNFESKRDSILLSNKIKLKKQLGKTIFADTTFGPIRVYKVENVNK